MTTRELYNEIWTNGHYREGSTCLRLIPWLKQHIPAGSEINDYGSGTGRAERGLLEFCGKINMVDFADLALEDDARSLIGDRLTYTISPLENLPEEFPQAEWGICINVLMVVDPAKLDAILEEMKRTCLHLIIEVYDTPDFRLGEDRTLNKMNPEQWVERLLQHWPKVEPHPSPEHPRRYIFICHRK